MRRFLTAVRGLWTHLNESPIAWPIVIVIIVVWFFAAPIAWFLDQFIHGPSGYALFVALVWLAVIVGLIRAFVWWFNRSNTTGESEQSQIHIILDKIFEDANASANLLGRLAIAVAIVIFATARGG